MAIRGQPMVRIVSTGGGGGRGGGSHGIKCCCCTCCNCMDLAYLWTRHGLIKLAELVIYFMIIYKENIYSRIS